MSTKYLVILCASLTVFAVVVFTVYRSTLIRAMMPAECDKNESCLRVCCPEDLCTDDNALRNLTETLDLEGIHENYRIIKGVPCEEFHEHHDFTFEENGHVVDADGYKYHWDEYCLHPKEHKTEYEYVEPDEEVYDKVLTCVPLDVIEESKSIFPYLMLSSVPFLIMTLVIYGLIKELRTLSGKCVMGYVLSLTLMYSSLAIVGLFNHLMLEKHNRMCKVMGYSVLAFILMCFCWLNVMCYDTWSTIKSIRQCGSTSKKFKRYCLYAFGAPILVASLVAALNEFKIVTPEWSTGIGNHSCSVGESLVYNDDEEKAFRKRAQFVYMYGPLALILAMNFGFYATTALTINKVQNEMRKYSTNERSVRAEKCSMRFALYARFFVMMGLPWTIEVLSWAMGDNICLYLASIINCLQGFVILVLFVMHKKIYTLIMKKSLPPTIHTNVTKYSDHRPLTMRPSNASHSRYSGRHTEVPAVEEISLVTEMATKV